MKEKEKSTGKILLKRKKKDLLAAFCILNKDLPSIQEKITYLHPNEQNHYNTLKYDKRKLSYLLGRIAAKKAINELIDVNDQSIFIDFGIFQFPIVKSFENHNIQVSISHCDNIAIVLAFPEEHPLGVDIEKIKEDSITAIKQQITDSEMNLILECQTSFPIGSMVVWTVKEAISKIFKTGLTMDFKMLEIQSLKKEGSIYLSSFTHFTQYKAISYHSGNYVCSIVLPKNTNPGLDQFWNSFAKKSIK
ncbi:4'-phosphopantetheinyl transferase superfamily protein [Flavobacterium sp. H122]|uniref:4'-phosphopantetheinyl transferase family protein n=1 Tax=Flavobacterium sp. H122 TaxID=2529860 RepID=UPI00145A3EC6|nr:4'-phosphopantetheinyl transferase superfamily protein [Flavobacterium sp. H122]